MQEECRTINFRILFLWLLFPLVALSQLSNTHYIPPLTSAAFGNANPGNQYIYISTPSEANVSYTIIPIGQLSINYKRGIVSNNNPKEIFIGSSYSQLVIASGSTSSITSNKGYIIEAESAIYVSIRMEAGINGNGSSTQAGALVSKGTSALGTTFRVGSFTNEAPQDNYLNFASVMATEDNTKVIFDDLTPGLVIKNYSGVTPIEVTLNKGQSYTIATNSFDTPVNQDGLIGTLISSDKNIVVNCGSANGSFHNGIGRDYGIDQIVDLSKVGKEYIFVRGGGTNDWENVLIVAHSNNTAISINGVPTGISRNAGEYYLIEGNKYNSSGNMYVETTEPVFAYQGVGSTGEANQGMFFVPPLSCETRGNLENIANIEDIGNSTYSGGISIVTKKGATITIKDQPTHNFNTIGPSDVTGNPDYVTYKVTGLTGNVSVQSDEELYCAYFNFNGAATSGSFYSGFPTPPEIDFNAEFETLGICIPNITLSVSNGENFDRFEWYFDDGPGYVATGITDVDFTPTISGTYKLIGILNCSGLELESQEVPVSICPDDIDNDGIIDNIDVDNDNDGILNNIESYGDQLIDLSNISGGTIPIGGYTYTGSVTIAGNTSVIPFIGFSDGTFMSETPGKNGTPETSVNYDLSFSKPLNIIFEYTTSTSFGSGLLTNDEEFIIQVPSSRTITLLDPDDQLLIDTDYDGVYETGVTQISSFEIRFKLKSSSLTIGSGTFSFSANSVDGFSYTHINKSDNNTSQVTFNIRASNLSIDSDNDGIEDSLDTDSDNDGIPDIFENKGEIIILSNSDDDNDGLDDIFNINDLPLDSDLDGVFNYIDLDSDNDGVFDLEESNAPLPDSNFDGQVDNAVTSIGLNGWVNAAEDSPDSGILNYVIADLDADTILNFLDNDSDGDNCYDVIEAGFSDANNDGYLGTPLDIVDVQGILKSTIDGYTPPNIDYLTSAPILIETQPFDTKPCDLTNAHIIVESSTAESYQWEVSSDGINWSTIVDNATYTNSQADILEIKNINSSFTSNAYRVFMNRTGNTCGRYSEETSLTILSLPVLSTPSLYTQCDDSTNDGIAQFNLTLESIKEEISPNYIAEGLSYTYFTNINDAKTASNPISNPSNYQNKTLLNSETIWVRVENLNGCFSLVTLEIAVSPSSDTLSLYNPETIYLCDDGNDFRDGIATFNIISIHEHISKIIFSNFNVSVHFYENLIDAELENNEILDITNYQNLNSPISQDIWVRVKNEFGNSCLGLVEFPNLLNVESLPEFSVDSSRIICESGPNSTISLDVYTDDPPGLIIYQWTDESGNMISTESSIEVSTSGIYTVTIVKTDNTICAKSEEIDVVYSEKANLEYRDITIVDDSDNNSITIDTTNLGKGDYEYSLDDEFGPYQNESFFDRIIPGIHTLYINDKNNCGLTLLEFSVIGFPKFFTPNQDGYNDYWKVLGVNENFYSLSTIYIFDRFGKILAKIDPSSNGWDGYYNGVKLPADDYWFSSILTDKDGNQRVKKGHFSMIPR